ncbi:zinc finger protein SNAI3 [Fukomys damarensis]|uniref:zinc finger protein SNAI3 n=1 Tax=Fukomys damarensis TaxID=885580 RepID=UPI00145531A7|nr:zinc finger protein SNAI3 [Fukomys damarensis]
MSSPFTFPLCLLCHSSTGAAPANTTSVGSHFHRSMIMCEQGRRFPDHSFGALGCRPEHLLEMGLDSSAAAQQLLGAPRESPWDQSPDSCPKLVEGEGDLSELGQVAPEHPGRGGGNKEMGDHWVPQLGSGHWHFSGCVGAEGNGTCFPHKEAPSTLSDLPRPWDYTSAVTCISLPLLPHQEEALGFPGPNAPEIGLGGPWAARAPSFPLRDSLNHLNLPPLLLLPTRWPPILHPHAYGSPDKLLGAMGAPRAPGGFECGHCHKAYHTTAGLARHQQLQCHLQAGRVFTCKHCDKEYGSLGALKMHIRTHTLPCVCSMCGKAFSRPWLLQGHIRTHTGEKPYTCPHCSRAFADRSNLRAHQQTHSGTKKYPCKGCGKTFSRMSLLTRHEEAGCCLAPEGPPCPES